jgi:hypothetical protein
MRWIEIGADPSGWARCSVDVDANPLSETQLATRLKIWAMQATIQ